jgi:4-hydroxybenzoate polyprenyltransferase
MPKLPLPIDRYLVRSRAWWFNKIPLSITLVLLLVDGRSADAAAGMALFLVVLTVCSVGNYGYGLNDLYDIEEDERAGRANAAATLGRTRTAWIVAISAILAELLAILTARWAGALLTLSALTLPVLYSLPPWRIKERKWLGVAADALAAHVYPAMLAMMAVAHFCQRPTSPLLIASLLGWSAAAGIRGILSHQLHTADRDEQAGLRTVVHDLGHVRIEWFIARILLPIELAGFLGTISACSVGWIFLTFGLTYLIYEAVKTMIGGFIVTAFRPAGQPYIAFVEESFYKAWGPIVITLDAARFDLTFLIVIPLYWLLFRRHLRVEVMRLRALSRALFKATRPS